MELSIPAGDFKCAVVAFEEGADSIYFGLTSFSARKGAVNFTIEQYRKVRKLALKMGKKIYIAFNTLIQDEEIPKVYRLLSLIEFIGCDGLIVQDWGVVGLVKKFFPNTRHMSFLKA